MASYPNLKWDLSRYQTVGAADALTNHWISKTGVLNETEQKRIAQYESWKEKSLVTKVHQLLSTDKAVFQAVEHQILSLLIAWKSVLHEKERYENFESKKKHKGFELNEDVISHEAFLRLAHIIPNRVMLGISELDSLVIPPESKKRKTIESEEDEDAPSRRTKRARTKDEEPHGGESDYEDFGSDGEEQRATDEEEGPYLRKGRNAINILFKKQSTQQPDEEGHQTSKKRRR